MRLYDSSGQLLATSSNNSDSKASLQITLAQGIHLLEVFGDAGPYANDYASQGHFYLTGSITPTTPDITPPDPNPMSFAKIPTALNDTQIEMQANTATDDSGGTVSYLFTCTRDTGTCDSSDWQTSPMYTATELASATEYCFSVQARDLSANITVASAQHCASTHAVQPQPEPPAAPSNLTLIDGQDGTATLSWQDNSHNEQSFEIQRESMHKSGRWRDTQIVALLDADSINFLDSSGTGTFRYRVRATNHVNASQWSAWQEVTVSDNNGGPDKPCKGKKCSN